MKKLSIVMYHYVRDLQNSRYPGIMGLDYTLFKKQIQFFFENYHAITMEELIAYYDEGYDFPENSVLLTFDDGYIDNYQYVLPILREYGMQGSFFVPGKVLCEHCLLDVNKIHFLLASTPIEILCHKLYEMLDYYRGQGKWDYPSNEELFAAHAVANRFDNKETIFFKRILQAVLPEELRALITSELFKKYLDVSEGVLARELYLNYDQMKQMKREGMFFGSHGYNHYWMNKLSAADLARDIDKSLEVLDGLIDTKKWVINYPYGSYSENVITYVRENGAVLGLSTDVGMVDDFVNKRFQMPRLDTNDFPPKSENYKNYK